MFLNFATENWYLFVMLAAILLLLVFDPSGKMAGGATKIPPAQLPVLQNRKSAVLVDIRGDDEFASGHIEQSIHLPLDTIESGLKKLKKHKGKPLILVCQTGNRAVKAANVLKKNEFEELFILDGGIASWSKENLPLAKN